MSWYYLVISIFALLFSIMHVIDAIRYKKGTKVMTKEEASFYSILLVLFFLSYFFKDLALALGGK